ncbi:MAG: hypothetical protein AABX79_02845 [Nanoarchaeota archaeon]
MEIADKPSQLEKEVKEKIKGLVAMLAEDFLREMKGNHHKRVIGLLGSNETILNFTKEEFVEYFKRVGENVDVFIGRGNYPINVDYFLKNFS